MTSGLTLRKRAASLAVWVVLRAIIGTTGRDYNPSVCRASQRSSDLQAMPARRGHLLARPLDVNVRFPNCDIGTVTLTFTTYSAGYEASVQLADNHTLNQT